MQQKVWNFVFALGMLVIILLLAIMGLMNADSFVSVFFIVLSAIAGTLVSFGATNFLGASRFPKLPPELAVIALLFVIALVAFIFQVFDEALFLKALLAVLAYILGRS